LQVIQEIFGGEVREVLHRIHPHAIETNLLLVPHQPVAVAGPHVVVGLHGVVGGGVGALAVGAGVVADIGAEERRVPVAGSRVVALVGVEILPVFREAARATEVVGGALVGYGLGVAHVAKVLVFAGRAVFPGAGVLPARAGRGARPVVVVQHHVLNYFHAVGVQHGHGAQQLVLSAHTGAQEALLPLIAQVIVVERGVAVALVGVFDGGRNPNGIHAHGLEARGQVGEIISPAVGVVRVPEIPPEALHHYFLGVGRLVADPQQGQRQGQHEPESFAERKMRGKVQHGVGIGFCEEKVKRGS